MAKILFKLHNTKCVWFLCRWLPKYCDNFKLSVGVNWVAKRLDMTKFAQSLQVRLSIRAGLEVEYESERVARVLLTIMEYVPRRGST